MSGTDEPWNDVGRVLAGRYRLLGPIGRGGMGAVWHAVDEFLGRDVAVKQVLIPAGIPDADRVEICARSLREARIAARLRHPSLITIYDVIADAGAPQIVMELVPAPSLQDLIAEEGPLQPAQVAGIGLAVVGALRVAHAAGVLHRDVKPGNVLVGADGRVVLTDFGIARREGDPRITAAGRLIGSPGYIAPELALGTARASPASDLWSLGATLYSAVEGRPPYAEDSILALLTAATTEDAAPMRNPGPLAPVVRGLMERDPAARLTGEQAEKMLREVTDERTAQAHRGSPATSGPAPDRVTTAPLDADAGARPPGGRGGGFLRLLAAVVAVLAVAAAGLAVSSLGLGDRPPASQTFTYRDNEHGFSIAVPLGWQKGPSISSAYFAWPGTDVPDLLIEWGTAATTPPETHVENLDKIFQRDPKQRPGYDQDRRERVVVPGQDAAELEYHFLPSNGGGVTWRVLVRAVAMPSGTYTIRWRAPQDQWAETEQLRRAVLTSFQPVSGPTPAKPSNS